MRACELQIPSHVGPWHIAPIAKDVAAAAKLSHSDPARVFGDFDGDDRKDVALLIQRGTVPVLENPRRLASLVIVVCLNDVDGLKFFQIDKPYCGDGIALSPKGKPYHDFETEQNGFYRFDGVSAYALERAGATYEYEAGSFHRIIDSD